jgi:hypothetical protein
MAKALDERVALNAVPQVKLLMSLKLSKSFSKTFKSVYRTLRLFSVDAFVFHGTAKGFDDRINLGVAGSKAPFCPSRRAKTRLKNTLSHVKRCLKSRRAHLIFIKGTLLRKAFMKKGKECQEGLGTEGEMST